MKSTVEADYTDLSKVPACYMNLQKVFNKPKLHPFHLIIPMNVPLILVVLLPKAVSTPCLLHRVLVAGIIRPSSSPASAGFFFAEKKDKSLRSCTDYNPISKTVGKLCKM